MAIHIQKNDKKPTYICFHSKKPHTITKMNDNMNMDNIIARSTGADPGFQVRGGALKENAPSGGRREKFWGISCEKSRFYAKKSDFFQWRREARKFLGYFVWKITILRQKNIFFSNFRGGGGARGAPPWIPPCLADFGYAVDALWFYCFPKL